MKGDETVSSRFQTNRENLFSTKGSFTTLDQSRGRKTDGGTRQSQRRGEERATLVTVDQPFRHRTNQNQHPESGCWISLVHI